MPLTLGQFSQRLTSSGVMSADDLRDWLSALPNDKRPSDGEQMARELVKQKQLTAHQASTIYSGKGSSLVLGNYVVLDKLGQGGMGVVLKAEHRRMARVVAIKVMSPAALKSPEMVKRFHREVQAAAKLEHPNIVTAHDADEVNGTHFLVMQFVDGDDLSAVVKKNGALPLDRAVDCILQAARGLEFAHRQGVIHRDIKPHNLLLSKEGVVKVLDMGLARIEEPMGSTREATLTSTGAVMGTIDYMSPEQALDTKTADARSDIYSLGCTLFYLLTGDVPFPADTMMKRLLAHREAPIPSLMDAVRRLGLRPDLDFSAGRDGVPTYARIDFVFQRMVAKKPQDRYGSMTEVIADLQRCVTAQMSPALAVSAPSQDAEFNEFLRRMSDSDHSQSPAGATAAVASAERTILLPSTSPLVPVDAATAEWKEGVSDTDPNALSGAKKSKRPRRSRGRVPSAKAKLIAAGVFAVVAVVGLTLWLGPSSSLTDGSGQTADNSTNKTDSAKATPKSNSSKSDPSPVAKSTTKPSSQGKPSGDAAGARSALAMNGAGDYVELAGLPELAAPLTMEAWVEPTDSQKGHLIFVGAPLWTTLAINDGVWMMSVMRKDRSFSVSKSSQPVAANRKVHVAGCWDGQKATLFVDGKRMYGTATAQGFEWPGLRQTYLGRNTTVGSPGVIGKLFGVRLSKSVRYTDDFSPAQTWTTDANTVALYQCDEGSGTALKDSSKAGRHGKIVGAKWTTADRPSDADWIELFNGKDLSGWKEMGVKFWSVTNGVIVGKTTSNSGWLMSERVYGDYELELEYKLSPGSNSGLFLRAWPEGNISGNQFREIQLLDDEAPAFTSLGRERRTGSIFGMVAPQTTPKVPANQWHRVRVNLQGQQVQVSINGIEVLKHTLNDLPPLGRIGLQLYPTQVEFRNIRVRPLDSATGSR